MLRPVWTSVAVLLAFATGFAAFALLSGLPANVTVPIWSSGPAWSPSRAGNLVLSGSVAAGPLVGVLVNYAIAAQVWEALGVIADLLVQRQTEWPSRMPSRLSQDRQHTIAVCARRRPTTSERPRGGKPKA